MTNNCAQNIFFSVLILNFKVTWLCWKSPIYYLREKFVSYHMGSYSAIFIYFYYNNCLCIMVQMNAASLINSRIFIFLHNYITVCCKWYLLCIANKNCAFIWRMELWKGCLIVQCKQTVYMYLISLYFAHLVWKLHEKNFKKLYKKFG